MFFYSSGYPKGPVLNKNMTRSAAGRFREAGSGERLEERSGASRSEAGVVRVNMMGINVMLIGNNRK